MDKGGAKAEGGAPTPRGVLTVRKQRQKWQCQCHYWKFRRFQTATCCSVDFHNMQGMFRITLEFNQLFSGQ